MLLVRRHSRSRASINCAIPPELWAISSVQVRQWASPSRRNWASNCFSKVHNGGKIGGNPHAYTTALVVAPRRSGDFRIVVVFLWLRTLSLVVICGASSGPRSLHAGLSVQREMGIGGL